MSGCARLSVKSDPPDARILWSPDGQEDWRPWPPRTWGKPPQPGEEKLTPYSTMGGYFDTVWITVEKDGYFRPLPQAAQLYTFRNETLRFELVETPTAFEARQRAAGLVPYRGQWVDPAAAGLAEYNGVWMPRDEAFRAEQRAKGLVEYQGNWLAPAEYETRVAADQTAKGLVSFKGRWMTPEAQAAEEALDTAAAALAERRDVAPLDAPRVIGRTDLPTAQVQLLNATGNAVRFLLSGPTTREITVPGYGSYGLAGSDRLLLEPGRYRVAAIPRTGSGAELSSDPDATPAEPSPDARATDAIAFLESPLSPGFQYLYTFNGGRGFDLKPEEEYRLGDPDLPANLPTIEIPEIELPKPQPTPAPGEGGERRRGGGQRPGGGGGPR